MAQVVVLNHDQIVQEQAAARILQERYDMALQPWDRRAPEPVLGESYDSYRRKTLIRMKRLLPDDHKLRKVQVNQMDETVLKIFEPQIMSACREAAYDPTTVPTEPGPDGRVQFRRVTERDQNGMTIVKYIGPRSFVEDFKAPVRRVKSFMHQPHLMPQR
jgi:hypothetical protein